MGIKSTVFTLIKNKLTRLFLREGERMKSSCEIKLVGEVVTTPYRLEAKPISPCGDQWVGLE